MKAYALAFVVGTLVSGSAGAKDKKPGIVVTMNEISAAGTGKSVGTVRVWATPAGVRIAWALKGLPPGEHGFHVHENGSCAPAEKDGQPAAGMAAGGHYDPASTHAHRGPSGGGHKGDLPKIVVDDKGAAKAEAEVPGLSLADLAGRALMIHAGGDNYGDVPKPLGGGGARIVCGVAPAR